MMLIQFFCIRFSIYNKFFHIPSCSEKWQTIIPNCKSSKNLCSSSNVNYLYILPSNEQNFLIGLQITSLEVMFRDVCFFNMWSLKGGGIWMAHSRMKSKGNKVVQYREFTGNCCFPLHFILFSIFRSILI